MSTMTAREFNRDVSAAKRAASDGPVVITDRGEPAFVLLSIADYRNLGSRGIDLVERLSIDGEIEVDFAPVRLDLTDPGAVTYLLDTNVVSELRKPAGRADPRVRAWVAARQPAALYLSAITILEIELGIGRLERRDRDRAERLRSWLTDDVLDVFSGRVLAVDVAVARAAARLHVSEPRPERDALIAATAIVRDLIVVTRNVADFERLGVALVDPWQG